MKDANGYNDAVSLAVKTIWIVNIIFSVVCVAFYQESTQDLVLQNLDNGPYLSALKLFLCIDLIFTFPIVFASGRQILENALLGVNLAEEEKTDESIVLGLKKFVINSGAVAVCFGLSQV